MRQPHVGVLPFGRGVGPPDHFPLAGASVRRSPIWSCMGRTRRAAGGAGSGFFAGRCLAIRATLPAPTPWSQGLTFQASGPGELGVFSRPAVTREATMNQQSLRALIHDKIRNGRLPHDCITRVWSSPSNGETCDACEAILSKEQLVMEGMTLAPSRRPFHFHVQCFQIWDQERRAA